ncbi:MAG: prolipoprotein diacylglyceryl transferase [Endomicrobiales bacterium]|nr:prolipoprotein diacylglyceryl transferase [Endomicrobiales bacterium]
MHPILFNLFGITIHTYGLLVALGLVAGTIYFTNRAKLIGVNEQKAIDLVFYTVLFGFIGARLLYVLLNISYFASNPVDIFKVWEGGLVFFGGLIGGAAAWLVFISKNKMGNVWALADILAPSLVLAHFFGRIGCFFAGCCYGSSANGPLCVTFSDKNSLAPIGIPLLPTQLFEAALLMFLFVFLHLYSKGVRTAGKVLALYIVIYGTGRFVIEFFRGDERGAFLLGLSPAQVISFVLIGLGIYIWLLKNAKNSN